MIKLLLLIFTVFLASSCQFTKAISSSFSKEFCSCHFVVGSSLEYCKERVSLRISVSEYKIDPVKKTVSSERFWHTSVAKHMNERMGCRLIN